MRPETAGCLSDARLACERILDVVLDVPLAAYEQDWKLQSIVERQFTIAGEAIVRIRELEAAIFERLPDVHRIIGFRNFLVHAYGSIDPERVFKIVATDVRPLIEALDELLAEANRQGL